MTRVIATAPTCFDAEAFAGRWFHWKEINSCFWPGRGGRATVVNPELAPVRYQGGVYCLAWSLQPVRIVGPTAVEVKYIGESNEFQRRIGQFGTSAGFWGQRRKAHSAGWRWPLEQTVNLWVCFFPVGRGLLPHLA